MFFCVVCVSLVRKNKIFLANSALDQEKKDCLFWKSSKKIKKGENRKRDQKKMSR